MKNEKEQLKLLRKEVFKLQAQFMDLLCCEDDKKPTKLEDAFCIFLWEIDEAARKLR